MEKQFTTEDLQQALKYHFSYDKFRPFQVEAIKATLAGRDSLLILPTGGGKSMTFQLPALTKSNCFTVVVGPLMALAKDQVDSCMDLGIDARVWNSDTPDEARRGIQSELVSDAPEMRLLYTTPESLRHPNLRSYLKEAYDAGTLLSFAIDEAHCVSGWGHEFRPAYLELANLKQDFPNTPIAAMTASCTSVVEAGIIKLLKLQDPLLIKGGFNRPNLQYTVLFKELINDGKQDDLVEHLVSFIKQREGQCGIIYARLRATCDWLGRALGSCDIDVGVYHAGKDAARRRKVQSDWCSGGLDIVVATVAFGMGIDRSDVRWVLHWDVPASLEGYYQESGRAGRDSQPSEAVLYVSADDLDTLTKLEKGNRAGSAAAVANFSCQGGCRRKKLLQYFGEKRSACDASKGELPCDHCSQPAATRQLIQQWEQQLKRKAVALVLQQQRAAAELAARDDDDDAEDPQGQDSTQAAAAAAAAGAAAGGVATGIGSSACSSLQGSSKPRPGAWAPAKAHCSSGVAVNPAAGAAAGMCGRRNHGQRPGQDENRQPAAAAADAGQAALGAANCTAGGVLLPQHPGGQQQAAAAAMAQAVKGPAEKPQLKKRRLSRGQQPWVAFKAPRKQPDSAAGSSTDGAAGHSSDTRQEVQQEGREPAQTGEQQRGAGASMPGIVAAAAAPALRRQQGVVAAAAAAVGGAGRMGLGRAGAGRQAFKPPVKR